MALPSLFGLGLLGASAMAAVAQTVSGRAIEVGSEAAIAQAELRLHDHQGAVVASVLTDSTGAFSISAEMPGEYVLGVDHIAFTGIMTPILRLNERETVFVEVWMQVEAIALDPLVVVARRHSGGPFLEEFYGRADRNRAIRRGRIYFRDDLNRVAPFSVDQLLFTLPWRNRCEPDVFLNGSPVHRDLLDTLGNLEHVEGVEIYRGVGEIPFQYVHPDRCAVMLIWLTPHDGHPHSWARIGVAALFGLLVLLLL